MSVLTSDWIVVYDYCATRIVSGGDVMAIKDRVAFIEKTPRIRVKPFSSDSDDYTNWMSGSKGSDGFSPASRAWADTQLRLRGYNVPNPVMLCPGFRLNKEYKRAYDCADCGESVWDHYSCLNIGCAECNGTGRKPDGSSCVHVISCPCTACSPRRL